MQSYQSH